MDYEPLQTLSKPSPDQDGQIRFWKFRPSKQFQPFVYCYSGAVSTTPIKNPFLHRIIPDGCINIIWNLRHPSGRYGFITGPLTKAQYIPFTDQVLSIGICLLPCNALYFIDNYVSLPVNRSVPLESVFGRTDSQMVSEQLTLADSLEHRIAILEKYIASHFSENRKVDPTLNNALHIIYQHRGDVKISELAERLQISHRQLGRKFSTWIGMSPKTFSRIIRFQNVLKMLPKYSTKEFLSIALDGGYYDQPHFIHEFNSLYGLPPGKLEVGD